MSGAAAVAAQLRSESWAAGASRSSGGGCDGIPGFAGWLITYVQPLPQWMDELQGDPGAIAMRSSEWRMVESSVSDLTLDLASAARALDDLDGRTVRALRQRYEDVSRVLTDVQDWAGAASSALALASTLVTACRDAICGLLNALARLSDSLTSFTLNPFDKLDAIREFADAAWDIIVLARDLIEQLLTALAQLAHLLEALAPIVEDGASVLRDLLGRMLPGLAAATGGGVFGYLLGTGLGDMLRSTPRVTEFDPKDAASPEDYQKLMDQGEITSPRDLLAGNRLVDGIGQTDSTAISVSTVRRPDGSTYTLVNLPSTQDWGALKAVLGGGEWTDTFRDAGPLNDLDSNIALMLMDNPVLRTQYERAVMQALSDAGVPPGSDVVWSGFSQGGIMAGNLGADTSLPYRTVGVVTNGAPIDNFDIPSNVPVLQVEHFSDPVAKLDKTPVDLYPHVESTPWGPGVGVSASVPSNVDWVMLPDPDGVSDVNETHNAANYERDFGRYLDAGGDLKNDWSFLNGRVEQIYVARTGE
ncbi:hypothetical protein [Microbacterium sp. SORGH_AS_0421]|uniref:hypothetical protein n=1 Tax=Microbacterium sp. SORGH_AS_0421 TaxID=3041768 RepID=UPI00278CC878|nr:hypothetical protein [Microbacterium sp. SORGH_AS_0421]MDQ1177944.1 hypothetical protein [Microbacterium sp. SORGH_AS_0421]